MTIRPLFFVLCDAAVETSGKMNLIGLFDRIQTVEMPVMYPHLCVVAKLYGGMDERKHTAVIRFVDTLGQDLLPPTPPLDFNFGPSGVAQITLRLDKLPIRKEGFWTVKLFVDGAPEPVATHDLVVEQVKRSRPGAHPENP